MNRTIPYTQSVSSSVRAARRSISPVTDVGPFQIGDWRVEPASNRLHRGGRTYPLQPLSMQVLVHLARRAGGVARYDELLADLWPGRVVGDDAVHRRVADLRRRLGDDARAPRYIETIPKRGYRLVAPVETVRQRPAGHGFALRAAGAVLASVGILWLLAARLS